MKLPEKEIIVKSVFIAYVLIAVTIVCFLSQKIKKNPPICENFIYQKELKEDGNYETIAYPKKEWTITHRTTCYQFNIIHMTDSIRVYDGDRYVGICKDNNLDSLLIQDNQ